jgi:hypothetical protein
MSSDTQRSYNCIIVKKNGSLKQLRPITADEKNQPSYVTLSETSETYASVFRLHTTWVVKKHGVVVELWGRTTGRAGQENTYEFPPPVDEVLFFGNCLLVLVSGNSDNSSPQLASLTLDVWKKVYATLFGGFHDLDKLENADETEYDELVDVSDKCKTKEGYLKDGFIVEDGAEKIQKPVARKNVLNSSSATTTNSKKPAKAPKAKVSADEAIACASYILSLSSSLPQQQEFELEEESYELDP